MRNLMATSVQRCQSNAPSPHDNDWLGRRGGAVRAEQLFTFDVLPEDSLVQRRVAVGDDDGQVGPGGDQHLEAVVMPVPGGDRSRGPLVCVCHIYVCAGLDEKPGELVVAVEADPPECGRSELVLPVEVGPHLWCSAVAAALAQEALQLLPLLRARARVYLPAELPAHGPVCALVIAHRAALVERLRMRSRAIHVRISHRSAREKKKRRKVKNNEGAWSSSRLAPDRRPIETEKTLDGVVPCCRAMPPKPARAPVLIAGGGPVGLYTSVLLSRFGVPSILLERQRAGIPHPRAHLINTRSMELFREVGLDQRVESLAPPMREWREFRYCRSLLGRQIACDDHMATPAWDVLQEASPARLTHVSQPGLEEVLREEAARLAPEAGSQLLFGYECAHFDVLPGGGVRVEARRATRGGGGEGGGEGEVIEMEGSALLACDGAHSPVRRALGLRLSGAACCSGASSA